MPRLLGAHCGTAPEPAQLPRARPRPQPPIDTGVSSSGTIRFTHNSTGAPQNSVYDWFIGYLMARYKYQAPATTNGLGPLNGYTLGNPLGAYITALCPVNEPNRTNSALGSAPTVVGTMITTAENASYYWGTLPGMTVYSIWILGPDLIDTDNYRAFGQGVLQYLQSWWHPRVYIGWSHHNYGDIRYAYSPARAVTARDDLYNYNWKGGGDRYLWLTEGGYSLPSPQFTGAPADYFQLTRGNYLGDPQSPPPYNWYNQLYWQDQQARTMADSWYRMGGTPAAGFVDGTQDIYMFTQHGISDGMDSHFNSELRDDFDGATVGQARELWYRWQGFPAYPGM